MASSENRRGSRTSVATESYLKRQRGPRVPGARSQAPLKIFFGPDVLLGKRKELYHCSFLINKKKSKKKLYLNLLFIKKKYKWGRNELLFVIGNQQPEASGDLAPKKAALAM
jgi:hypothetical protein